MENNYLDSSIDDSNLNDQSFDNYDYELEDENIKVVPVQHIFDKVDCKKSYKHLYEDLIPTKINDNISIKINK